MFWSKRFLLGLLALAGGDGAFAADSYIIGLGAEGDTADSLSFSAFGDFGVTEKTWVSVMAGKARAGGALARLHTVYGDVGVDHHFDPFGVRVDAGYWGDEEILDSVDFRGSLYLRTESLKLSVDYEKRNFDFLLDFRFPLLRREVGFDADGFGLSFRTRAGARTNLHLRGMKYDYSVDLTRLQNISDLNFLSASRLSLANSLLEHRVDAGVDVDFGLRTVGVEVGSRRTAIDGSTVNSVSFGLLFPAGESSDLELRLGYDDSETFGGTTVLSLFWYFYGT